ncbi:SpoIVB peptidase [Marvinbryantia formatexigens DSM 14469]|uniref:SpoIVB peptidase n=1 Tax=Marvinbryantia formatexigens DSM 14469 TaxID=478749 RepID=C6LLG9_9FIRM|nr:SpoIVB peptidase [Marvinbryantia formatexigens DSM 14469]
MRNLEKKRKGRYICPLFALLIMLALLEWYLLLQEIPDYLQVPSDSTQENLLGAALPDWVEETVKEAAGGQTSDIPQENLHISAPDSYVVECSLLGVLPVKDVQVEVVERQQLIPSGMPVGIYMKTEGVLIVGTGEVCDVNGQMCEPGGEIVHSGDYILAVNDVPVSEKEEVVNQMNQAVGGEVKLTVLRKGERTELQVPVVQTAASEYKAGIWIRDDTQGIGTLTYLKDDGSFGALGHGISDIDTSTLLNLQSGTLYNTDIRAVVKGENGVPGELSGIIRYSGDEILGTVRENTGIGIFGDITSDPGSLAYCDALDIAYKQEIREGAATILSAVDGEVKEYDIAIEKINLNSSDANKSMVIRVTDENLLALTGGIVQGMSGSTILQDGRIVGAVTHVFVNDPTKGYGIFIENMLEH